MCPASKSASAITPIVLLRRRSRRGLTATQDPDESCLTGTSVREARRSSRRYTHRSAAGREGAGEGDRRATSPGAKTRAWETPCQLHARKGPSGRSPHPTRPANPRAKGSSTEPSTSERGARRPPITRREHCFPRSRDRVDDALATAFRHGGRDESPRRGRERRDEGRPGAGEGAGSRPTWATAFACRGSRSGSRIRGRRPRHDSNVVHRPTGLHHDGLVHSPRTRAQSTARYRRRSGCPSSEVNHHLPCPIVR
jgi:hypothetical protein